MKLEQSQKLRFYNDSISPVTKIAELFIPAHISFTMTQFLRLLKLQEGTADSDSVLQWLNFSGY